MKDFKKAFYAILVLSIFGAIGTGAKAIVDVNVMESKQDQLEKRINETNATIDSVGTNVDNLRNEINDRFDTVIKHLLER